MELRRYSLRLRGPLGGPIQADTLWGQLCWALLETEGKPALVDFIEACRSGHPPVLLSDAFPAGHLPRPILPALATARRDAFAAEHPLNDPGSDLAPAIQAHQRLKKLKSLRWLKAKDLATLADGLSESALLEHLWTKDLEQCKVELPALTPSVQPHVSINRATGKALDGQLFASEIFFVNGDSQQSHFDLYVRLDGFDPKRFFGLLQLVGLSGYGRDASTGGGQFGVEEAPAFEWPEVEANAAMALSAFVPSAKDPAEGTWRVTTKFGRVSNALPDNDKPFKVPLLMLEAGSVLRGDVTRGFFGTLMEKVHANPAVVHSGFALALPLRLATEEEVNHDNTPAR